MPTVVHYRNYYIYFTTKCLREPIHIHINVGAPSDDGNSAKLWISSSGELIEEHRGIFSNKKYAENYKDLCEMAKNNITKAELLWLEKNKGHIDYIDVVGRFNVKQYD